MMTVKLCDICHIEKWKTGIKQAISGDFPMVTTAEKRISHESYQIDAKAVIIPLVSSTGHGHASINRLHYQEGKFALGSILCAVTPKDESILSARWLYQFLSFNKDDILVPLMKGAANVSLSIKRIGDIEIQLPSIEQQEEALIIIESLSEKQKRFLNTFSEQNSHLESLRSAILREAVQGKLVPQDPSEWNARDLLEQIRKKREQSFDGKKLKKSEIKPIDPSEIPFEIPENWAWCRLGEITNYGTCPKLEPKKLDSTTWVLDLEDIEKESSRLLVKIRFEERNSLSTKNLFRKGEVLYSKLRPYLDKVIVADEDGVCTTEILPLSPEGGIIPEFLLTTLKSSFFLSYANSVTKGMKMPRLWTKEWKNALIPLAPIAEQIRIVQKIDELTEKFKGLETSIAESKSLSERLLKVGLKEVFNS